MFKKIKFVLILVCVIGSTTIPLFPTNNHGEAFSVMHEDARARVVYISDHFPDTAGKIIVLAPSDMELLAKSGKDLLKIPVFKELSLMLAKREQGVLGEFKCVAQQGG